MNKNLYNEVDQNPNFPNIEEKILKFWKDNQLFQRSIDERPATIDGKNNEFIFYDGPPFANGLPHYGHLLTGFEKDLVARYQTMLGKKVERRFGWDCHGLPAEMGSEKELKISGRHQIMEYGVDKFNEHCRSSVLKYTSEWEEYVTRQARWVDFKNDYKTMDKNFMESVLWAFKELHNKNLVYESLKVMPYSWACETPLSNFETRLDNSYREVADKAVTVGFEFAEKPSFLPAGHAAYRILAWTTTPWTLPSNLMLAVGPKLEYTYLVKNNICYVMAKYAVNHYMKDFGLEAVPELATIKAEDLVGLHYKPLFDYFKDHPNSFRIVGAEFVMEGDGTGVVHCAPGFGEEDQLICEANNVAIVCPVDNAGKFTSEVPDYEGMQVFTANEPIIIKLKETGAWLKTEQYLHNYPHCWRTDTPLIYKAVPSWYVEVTKFRDRMVEHNQKINWVPTHIKDGLFGKWLENARDWSISRNRFWGTPIPVWKSDDPKYPRIDVYGSISDLEKDFGVKVTDLHKHYLDKLERPNPNDPTGKSKMKRVEEVFDCWFESGSMPFAQAHYPFENKEWFETHCPADFITEYVAQTRGWFYTLMVLSTALFDRPPFLNCVCHGVILDTNGQKLSKRLNNYADPQELFKKYGADPMRYLMISSPVMRGQELLIDKDGDMVKEVVRLSVKPLWNSYNFFVLYANSDKIKAKISYDSDNILDRYILAKLKAFTEIAKKSYDQYDTMLICQEYQKFIEALNNWYIRRSRSRFWDSEKTSDKQQAYDSLYTVLVNLTRIMAPILPLVCEEIHLNLLAENGKIDAKNSVHLSLFPDANLMLADPELISDMDKLQDICNTALSIRNDENIKVRIPLGNIEVIGKDLNRLAKYDYIIKDEVNVKNVSFKDDYSEYASLKLQLNFKELGKRLADKMKTLIGASKTGSWQVVDNVVTVAGEKLNPDEYTLLLETNGQKNVRGLPQNDSIVILDLVITEELHNEGVARDLVRMIQSARKASNLQVSDRISLHIEANDEIMNSIAKFNTYICEQTLAEFTSNSMSVNNYEFITDGNINGMDVKISFSVAK